MELERILVATDLTKTANTALQHAIVIAKKANAAIDLLHIVDNNTTSALERDGLGPDDLTESMQVQCDHIKDEHGLESDFILHEGNIFEGIPFIAAKGDHQLMVLGTHGVRGLRQNLFGADILKVVKNTPIPSLIVQGEHTPWENIDKIVFPVGGHDTFKSKIKATCMLAALFGSEVEIYSVDRPGEEPSPKLLNNIESAKAAFTECGILFKDVHEDPTVYSVGFAKQTIAHAEKINADLIAVMSVSSKEHYYFEQADKERLLTNDARIPVICSGDTV
jgi:nucleotide-binding universal stress UspA family protein